MEDLEKKYEETRQILEENARRFKTLHFDFVERITKLEDDFSLNIDNEKLELAKIAWFQGVFQYTVDYEASNEYSNACKRIEDARKQLTETDQTLELEVIAKTSSPVCGNVQDPIDKSLQMSNKGIQTTPLGRKAIHAAPKNLLQTLQRCSFIKNRENSLGDDLAYEADLSNAESKLSSNFNTDVDVTVFPNSMYSNSPYNSTDTSDSHVNEDISEVSQDESSTGNSSVLAETSNFKRVRASRHSLVTFILPKNDDRSNGSYIENEPERAILSQSTPSCKNFCDKDEQSGLSSVSIFACNDSELLRNCDLVMPFSPPVDHSETSIQSDLSPRVETPFKPLLLGKSPCLMKKSSSKTESDQHIQSDSPENNGDEGYPANEKQIISLEEEENPSIHESSIETDNGINQSFGKPQKESCQPDSMKQNLENSEVERQGLELDLEMSSFVKSSVVKTCHVAVYNLGGTASESESSDPVKTMSEQECPEGFSAEDLLQPFTENVSSPSSNDENFNTEGIELTEKQQVSLPRESIPPPDDTSKPLDRPTPTEGEESSEQHEVCDVSSPELETNLNVSSETKEQRQNNGLHAKEPEKVFERNAKARVNEITVQINVKRKRKKAPLNMPKNWKCRKINLSECLPVASKLNVTSDIRKYHHRYDFRREPISMFIKSINTPSYKSVHKKRLARIEESMVKNEESEQLNRFSTKEAANLTNLASSPIRKDLGLKKTDRRKGSSKSKENPNRVRKNEDTAKERKRLPKANESPSLGPEEEDSKIEGNVKKVSGGEAAPYSSGTVEDMKVETVNTTSNVMSNGFAIIKRKIYTPPFSSSDKCLNRMEKSLTEIGSSFDHNNGDVTFLDSEMHTKFKDEENAILPQKRDDTILLSIIKGKNAVRQSTKPDTISLALQITIKDQCGDGLKDKLQFKKSSNDISMSLSAVKRYQVESKDESGEGSKPNGFAAKKALTFDPVSDELATCLDNSGREVPVEISCGNCEGIGITKLPDLGAVDDPAEVKNVESAGHVVESRANKSFVETNYKKYETIAENFLRKSQVKEKENKRKRAISNVKNGKSSRRKKLLDEAEDTNNDEVRIAAGNLPMNSSCSKEDKVSGTMKEKKAGARRMGLRRSTRDRGGVQQKDEEKEELLQSFRQTRPQMKGSTKQKRRKKSKTTATSTTVESKSDVSSAVIKPEINAPGSKTSDPQDENGKNVFQINDCSGKKGKRQNDADCQGENDRKTRSRRKGAVGLKRNKKLGQSPESEDFKTDFNTIQVLESLGPRIDKDAKLVNDGKAIEVKKRTANRKTNRKINPARVSLPPALIFIEECSEDSREQHNQEIDIVEKEKNTDALHIEGNSHNEITVPSSEQAKKSLKKRGLKRSLADVEAEQTDDEITTGSVVHESETMARRLKKNGARTRKSVGNSRNTRSRYNRNRARACPKKVQAKLEHELPTETSVLNVQEKTVQEKVVDMNKLNVGEVLDNVICRGNAEDINGMELKTPLLPQVNTGSRRSARKVEALQDKENSFKEPKFIHKASTKQQPSNVKSVSSHSVLARPTKRQKSLFNKKNSSLMSLQFSMLEDATVNTTKHTAMNTSSVSMPQTLSTFLRSFVAPKIKKKSS